MESFASLKPYLNVYFANIAVYIWLLAMYTGYYRPNSHIFPAKGTNVMIREYLRTIRKLTTYTLIFILVASCSSCGIAQDSNNFSSDTKFEIGFSPKGSALEIILKGIRESEKSILVAAYSFTSKPISTELVAAYKRGVDVKVIADKKSNSGKYSAVTFLANQGVPVRLNGNYQIFHHKFMVFDGLHVETGSFNYSAAAVNKNAENVIMITGNKSIADEYSQQWNKLWNESLDLQPNY